MDGLSERRATIPTTVSHGWLDDDSSERRKTRPTVRGKRWCRPSHQCYLAAVAASGFVKFTVRDSFCCCVFFAVVVLSSEYRGGAHDRVCLAVVFGCTSQGIGVLGPGGFVL